MKILRLDAETFPPSQQERDVYHEMGFEDTVEMQGKTPEEIIAAGRDADFVVVVSNYLRANVIKEFQKCRAIMRRGTGCDKIDVDFATERGIIVSNLPVFAITDVADHAILLMLALARMLPQVSRAVETKTWLDSRINHQLVRILGKTLGLVGFGNIGKAVAVRAKSFGMDVLSYHRKVKPEEEASLGVTPTTLENLLTDSDFIAIVCPLTNETREMIGRKQIEMMKSTAFLINVGRGGVCDEPALAEALRERRIAGAGIDVFEHINMFSSPEGQDECLYQGLDNVILTPHCAANSMESATESLEKSAEQMRMILAGVFPSSCVNPQVYEKIKDRYTRL